MQDRTTRTEIYSCHCQRQRFVQIIYEVLFLSRKFKHGDNAKPKRVKLQRTLTDVINTSEK